MGKGKCIKNTKNTNNNMNSYNNSNNNKIIMIMIMIIMKMEEGIFVHWSIQSELINYFFQFFYISSLSYQ